MIKNKTNKFSVEVWTAQIIPLKGTYINTPNIWFIDRPFIFKDSFNNTWCYWNWGEQRRTATYLNFPAVADSQKLIHVKQFYFVCVCRDSVMYLWLKLLWHKALYWGQRLNPIVPPSLSLFICLSVNTTFLILQLFSCTCLFVPRAYYTMHRFWNIYGAKM